MSQPCAVLYTNVCGSPGAARIIEAAVAEITNRLRSMRRTYHSRSKRRELICLLSNASDRPKENYSGTQFAARFFRITSFIDESAPWLSTEAMARLSSPPTIEAIRLHRLL